jgi:hypothetical protein
MGNRIRIVSLSYFYVYLRKQLRIKMPYYKNLRYSHNIELGYIEVFVESPEFTNEKSSISALSNLVELVALQQVKYIIFNKKVSDFELATSLHGFVKKYIYKHFQLEGVEKVFLLMNNERFEKDYKAKFSDWNQFMIASTSMETIEEFISKMKLLHNSIKQF